MRNIPALRHWMQTRPLAPRPAPTTVLAAVLGLTALAGWGAFAGKAWSQRDLTEQVELLQADRGRLLAGLKQIEQTNAELARDGQEKLASVRDELTQALTARDAAKGQLAGAQRELTTLKKRLDQARDRVAETGSIKPAEAKKTGR
ncbi:hypothetical protein U8607_08820 [Methylobacterium durans]|uniref:hypothetical protein n=1 Tax=Methylobacterium durans TaxID=2202825 RepID=UPI002B0039AD|nr:hypothetical protein [Methylobacterium durans]MEA1832183.1 hypothetical protein [Methylobacterium durans]